MSEYYHVILYALLGGVISLIGGILLLSRQSIADSLSKHATAFAAGALLGVAFFDLLPESFGLVANEAASKWALGGLLVFFLLEHMLHWFHHHGKDDHEHTKTAAPLIIAGDTVHNFIDGLAIGAAFLISPSTGIVTAIAIAAHEIPQEIGDFGLLLRAGFSRKKVLLVNVASSLATLLGALLTFWLGNKYDLPLGELLAITAGLFIYIAASDLIPAVHDEAKGRTARLPALLLIAGVLVVGTITHITHEKLHQLENATDANSTMCNHEQLSSGHTDEHEACDHESEYH